jgi:DNA-binding GntR family transcriptional regulator
MADAIARHRKTSRAAAPAPAGGDAYARLRALIVSGRLPPGTRIIEVEFARKLAISRTPIREAMRRLAQEGLANIVSAGAKTQIAVAPVTREDLLDLFNIIGALEGVAGRGVARLDAAARRELAATLTTLNRSFEIEARRRERDFPAFFAAHDAFHTLFVDRCASPRLRSLVDAVRPQVQRYEVIYAAAVGDDFSDSLREHQRIVTAFRGGNPDAVERAIRLNWSNSADRLLRGSRATLLHAMGDYRVD